MPAHDCQVTLLLPLALSVGSLTSLVCLLVLVQRGVGNEFVAAFEARLCELVSSSLLGQRAVRCTGRGLGLGFRV